MEVVNKIIEVADPTGGAVSAMRAGVQGDYKSAALGMAGMVLNFRSAGLALGHFQKHAGEFGGHLNNAVEYVKAARSFITSGGSDVIKYANSSGKVLVYNKATNEFATHTGKTIHTYFKPKDAIDYVNRVIKKEGYRPL
jgi:hypothetical protein